MPPRACKSHPIWAEFQNFQVHSGSCNGPLVNFRLLSLCECASEFSSPSLPQPLMTSPNPPALQHLHGLDKSLPGFSDRLNEALHGEEYKQCVPNLQGDDLLWLVDYLDKVRRPPAPPPLPAQPARFSMVSIPSVTFPGSAYTNSRAYVAPEQYYPPRTPLRSRF